MPNEPNRYILATGAKEVERLRLLQEVYGPQSEALLRRAGLREGMRVVEFGCGSGNVSCWLATQVGPNGSVVGIDNSAAQIEQARRQADERGLRNVQFAVAEAYTPGLPPASFDLAYCRVVLIHLARPAEGLRAMRDLVRPGGRVVCEEMDLSRFLCDPPSPLMDRLFYFNVALGERHGGHFRLGTSLHRLFVEVGLGTPQLSANLPLAVRGETKRLLGISFLDIAAQLVEAGLGSQAEVDAVGAEAMRLADDDTTMFGFPLVVQAWASR
jgi:predicted O-methyltransferase YrrM